MQLSGVYINSRKTITERDVASAFAISTEEAGDEKHTQTHTRTHTPRETYHVPLPVVTVPVYSCPVATSARNISPPNHMPFVIARKHHSYSDTSAALGEGSDPDWSKRRPQSSKHVEPNCQPLHDRELRYEPTPSDTVVQSKPARTDRAPIQLSKQQTTVMSDLVRAVGKSERDRTTYRDISREIRNR